MTGLLGGGHGIYYDAATRTARGTSTASSRFPGSGRERREVALIELEVPFGTELVHYAVGIGSCGVPGVPAGLDALWNEHGSLPWPRLVEPALRLAAVGRADAGGARVVSADARAGDDDERGRARSTRPAARSSTRATCSGSRVWSPALESLAEDGPRGVVRGDDRARAAGADGGARRARHRRRPDDLRGPLVGAGRRRVPRVHAPQPRRALGPPVGGGAPARGPRPVRARTCARVRRRPARRRSRAAGHDERLRARRGRETHACSRRASASARATSCRGSTCT